MVIGSGMGPPEKVGVMRESTVPAVPIGGDGARRQPLAENRNGDEGGRMIVDRRGARGAPATAPPARACRAPPPPPPPPCPRPAADTCPPPPPHRWRLPRRP